jgi:hypothetical protein
MSQMQTAQNTNPRLRHANDKSQIYRTLLNKRMFSRRTTKLKPQRLPIKIPNPPNNFPPSRDKILGTQIRARV